MILGFSTLDTRKLLKHLAVESSLVGYWKFENNWNDSSGLGNNGTPVNSPTFTTTSRIGSYAANNLSGSNKITTPLVSTQTTNVTMSVWAYWTATSENTTLFYNGNPGSNGWGFIIANGSGAAGNKIGFLLGGISYDVFGATTVMPTNTWTHLAVTRSGSTWTFYFNGQPIKTGTTNPATPTGNTILGGLFSGSLDDASVWNAALSASEIQTIYARQSAKYSGQLTSRVLDAFSSQSWTTLSSTTTLPFYKELPGSSGSESTLTGYSSSGGGLMSGLVGLWHLNETSGTTAADSSGNSNAATFSGTFALNSNGILNGAPTFDGSSGKAVFGSTNLPTGASARTVQAWFKTFSSANQSIISYGSWAPANMFDLELNGGNVILDRGGGSVSAGSVVSNQWYHVVVVYDGSTMSIYLNGKYISSTSVTLATDTYGRTIGYGYKGFFNGTIDEVAIWSRALSSSEVLELYRRGANRVKYQVRSCANSDCSDQDALTSTYKGWKGPDNTGLSYFSELYNTTSNVLAGTVATSTPTMTFSNFTGTGLSVSANRYFQYRAVLESDDQNTLCNYGSGAVACSPELQAVTLGPNHFDTTIQSIISKASIGSAYQTLDTNGMTETLGGNSCSSGAKYSASSDGTNFYYWNGSAWATSSAYATANDAATMRSNISSFPSSAAGTGTLQIKTYLKSSGTSACEVDNLQFTGKKY